MSWNAHTDYIFNQMNSSESSQVIEYLFLGGPDGQKWGESGANKSHVSFEGIKSCKSNPFNGVSCEEAEKGKFIFIREIDNTFCYNKQGKGLAVMFCAQFIAYAVAAPPFKAEHSIDCLARLKSYMSSIGYN